MNDSTKTPSVDIIGVHRQTCALRARAIGQAARGLLRALARYGARPVAGLFRGRGDASDLARMDDRMLRDVGLTRGAIRYAPGAALTPANANEPSKRTDAA